MPTTAAAHGIGGRQDLPVPLEYFVVGSGLVLMVSFAALAWLWPRARWQEPDVRPMGGRWLQPLRFVTGTLGLLGLGLVVATGWAGVDDPTRNPAPVLVFVAFWLVMPFLSALVGDIYPLFEPWRRLTVALRLDRRAEPRGEERLGYWPAAVAFLLFTWLELVAPDSGPTSLAIAAVVYSVYLLAGAGWLGRHTAEISLDGFAVYNRLLGAMGPLDLTGDGPRWRGWIRGLPHLEERSGLTLMVSAMIGTVTFDGLSATTWWEGTLAAPITASLTHNLGLSSAGAGAVTGTIGLVASTALVAGAYLGASAAAARIAGNPATATGVARRFAHTLVPIAFAYAFAHYFTLVVYEGQYLLSSISDPFGRGWDLFGTADRSVDFTLLSPTAVWWIQLTTIVAGHMAGVVLAHDRALGDFPPLTAIRSQYAMLGLMVVLTGLGLTILAAG